MCYIQYYAQPTFGECGPVTRQTPFPPWHPLQTILDVSCLSVSLCVLLMLPPQSLFHNTCAAPLPAVSFNPQPFLQEEENISPASDLAFHGLC